MRFGSRPALGGAIIGGRPVSRRRWNGAGLAACIAAMSYALYVQHVEGLEPCHLCIFQRVIVIALGIAFAAALVHDPKRGGGNVYAALIGVLALCGLIVAGRHVWIQHQPLGSVGACGASLDVMLQMLPPSEVLTRVFRGGAECQKLDWTFLGLSMPTWVLLLFAVLGVGGVFANARRSRRSLFH